jgi:hypothetical protein
MSPLSVRVTGQDNRELSATILDDLHQTLQSCEGRMVQVMGLIDEKSNRLLGRTDQLLLLLLERLFQ